MVLMDFYWICETSIITRDSIQGVSMLFYYLLELQIVNSLWIRPHSHESVMKSLYRPFATWKCKQILPIPRQTASQLHILRLDSDAFGVDGTQVGIWTIRTIRIKGGGSYTF